MKFLNPLAGVAVVSAVVLAFFYAPTEAFHGDVQRIFYLHVPSAWVSYIAYITVAVASFRYLRDSNEKWDRLAVSAAEVGVVFTSIVLVTGPIWGYRIWGTPWVWDARLTSTLVLWVIYVGYLIFRALTPAGPQRSRRAAVIGLIGAVDIPIIHFAVVWWKNQHPDPAVFKPGAPDIPGDMLFTLLFSFAAYTLAFVALTRARLRLEQPAAERTPGVPTRELHDA